MKDASLQKPGTSTGKEKVGSIEASESSDQVEENKTSVGLDDLGHIESDDRLLCVAKIQRPSRVLVVSQRQYGGTIKVTGLNELQTSEQCGISLEVEPEREFFYCIKSKGHKEDHMSKDDDFTFTWSSSDERSSDYVGD